MKLLDSQNSCSRSHQCLDCAAVMMLSTSSSRNSLLWCLQLAFWKYLIIITKKRIFLIKDFEGLVDAQHPFLEKVVNFRMNSQPTHTPKPQMKRNINVCLLCTFKNCLINKSMHHLILLKISIRLHLMSFQHFLVTVPIYGFFLYSSSAIYNLLFPALI